MFNLLKPLLSTRYTTTEPFQYNERSSSLSVILNPSSSPTLTNIPMEEAILPPIYNWIPNQEQTLPPLKQVFNDYKFLSDRKESPNCSSLTKSTNHPSLTKKFSFVTLETPTKRRARRKHSEIDRKYSCLFPNCNLAYGALNHLNAHIVKFNHGKKRKAKEFKIRK